LTKFDLWRDCPYWPKHKFRRNTCIGCGFKKPKLQNLIREIRKKKSSLETRIDRILELRRQTANFTISWFDYNISLSDVYGNQKLNDYFGEIAPIVQPSAPLQGAKKRATRRLRKVAKVYDFYYKNWPTNEKNMDEIFEARKLDRSIRSHAETFLRYLMYYETMLTRKQTEQLVAAYSYYLCKSTEREVAEEAGSLFPEITRKTLRKWVRFVQDFEEYYLG